MGKHNKEIFAHRNKYEKNIFKRFGRWIGGLKAWQKCLIILVLLIILAGIMLASYVMGKLDKVNKVEVDRSKLSCVDVDGYINILLLGVDSRDMKNIKGTGADAIMILSIKEETGEVKLTSVYRDTFIKEGDTDTYTKITDTCRTGGPEMTMKSLNQALDIDLKEFVVVNFKAVSDLVNAVGGVTVDVQEEEIYQLNKYTAQTAHNIGQKKYKVVKKAGRQVLEGVQAVSYGRIRKGVGDDFKRTERMRIVLTKVFGKIKKMSLSEIDDLLDMMLPQVHTTLSNGDMLGLAARLMDFNIKSGKGWPYTVRGVMLNEVSYVFPDNLIDNVIKFHNDVFNQKDYKPSATVEAINSGILSYLGGADEQTVIAPNDGGVAPDGEKPTTTPNTKPESNPPSDKPQETKPTTPTPAETDDDTGGGDSGGQGGGGTGGDSTGGETNPGGEAGSQDGSGNSSGGSTPTGGN